jgi:hypothetical protein
MSSNFERLHEISNEAYAENLSILSQKLANPLLYLSLHFLMGIPFKKTYIVQKLASRKNLLHTELHRSSKHNDDRIQE